jgi:hypothetical protein
MTFPTASAPVRLKVEAAHPLEAEEHLNAAIAELQRLAMAERRQGILITRTAPGCYTVALSDLVPFGQTLEDPEEPAPVS